MPKHKMWLKRCQQESEERDDPMQQVPAEPPAGAAAPQLEPLAAAAVSAMAPAASTAIPSILAPAAASVPALVAPAAAAAFPAQPILAPAGGSPSFLLQALPAGTPAQNAVLQAAMYNFLMMGQPQLQLAGAQLPDLTSMPQLPMAALQRMFATFAQAAAAVAAGNISPPMPWLDPAGPPCDALPTQIFHQLEIWINITYA